MTDTRVYHDESVENDFLSVLGKREVAEIGLAVLNVVVIGLRPRSFRHLIISHLATAPALQARTQSHQPLTLQKTTHTDTHTNTTVYKQILPLQFSI